MTDATGRYIIFAAVILAVVQSAVAGAIVFAFRSSVVPAPYGYIERSRLTGRTVACSVSEPTESATRLAATLSKAGFSADEVAKHVVSTPRVDGARTCIELH